MIISEQARTIIKNMQGFDEKDFEKFALELPKVTVQGTNNIVQYLEMKERGLWKDGKFIEVNK